MFSQPPAEFHDPGNETTFQSKFCTIIRKWRALQCLTTIFFSVDAKKIKDDPLNGREIPHLNADDSLCLYMVINKLNTFKNFMFTKLFLILSKLVKSKLYLSCNWNSKGQTKKKSHQDQHGQFLVVTTWSQTQAVQFHSLPFKHFDVLL